MDITISSYDISDFEERLERSFDIRNGWGSEAVKDDNIIATREELGFGFPDGSVQAVLQKQQEVINKLDASMQVIYDRNRKLEHEVLDLQIAIRDSAKVLGKIKPEAGRGWERDDEGRDSNIEGDK